MTNPAPILASETSAAKLLDMKPAEFCALVERGHLPRGREIAPGYIRWDVEDLRRIIRGDAIDGMDGVQWQRGKNTLGGTRAGGNTSGAAKR